MKIIKWIGFTFMTIMGVLMVTDVTLVWLGHKTLVSSPYYHDFYNSKIWQYNISKAANMLMLMLGLMALYVSWFIIKFIK